MKGFLIYVCTKETMSMENQRELEDTVGQMVNSTKVNGWMVWSKGRACGKEERETPILVSGNLGRQMDMVCIHG